ncbi:MAG: hypothetical protein H7Y38_10915 [Armatimonadetes bacterium]|nr:hypothetical protein [Armatimonadota bacterium]
MTTPSDVWETVFERIASFPTGATVLLLGGTDTGKTTFAATAGSRLAETNERVAVVDADIGQSEIAPPGTVGVAWAREDAAKLSDLKPAAAFFVGAFSASALPLEHATATHRAVLHARARDANRILVDTSGFVTGPTARSLKCAKASLIQPDLILAFGADVNRELSDLANEMRSVCGAEIVAVPVAEGVQKKPTAMRSTRRQTRLAAYFGDKPTDVVVPLDVVQTLGATIGTGAKIAPHLADWVADALNLPVVHGEIAGDVLTLFLSGAATPGYESGIGAVSAHFGVRTVRVVSLSSHAGVLIGLSDDTGRLFALGRFAGFDENAVGIIVTVPGGATVAAKENTRLITFGRVRTGASGATVSQLKPGEL